MKVDKLSGDLRQAFDILRKTVEAKIATLQIESPSSLSVTYEDVNRVVNEVFQSKTAGIIKKVPRSHVILLMILESMFRSDHINQVAVDKLLSEYNKQAS